MEELIDKFTLVVPTYNRYTFLLRLLKFYQQYKFPFRIIVIDSSSVPLKSKELETLLCNEAITYQKCPSTDFLDKKLKNGIASVSTPFVAFCGDDDYLIPSGISQSVRFLNKNSGYSCAQGLYISHKIRIEKQKARFLWVPSYLSMASNIADRPHARIVNYLTNNKNCGGQQFYAVHKTKALKTVWEETVKYSSDYGLAEIFSGCMSLVLGKKKILPVFFSSREIHESSAFDLATRKKWYSQDRLKKAVNGLTFQLIKVDDLGFEEAKLIIRNAFSEYYARAFPVMETADKSGKSKIADRLAILKQSIRFKLFHLYLLFFH